MIGSSAATLTVLTPHPRDAMRYGDWRSQAEPIEALFPDVAIRFRPWNAPYEPATLTLPVLANGYHLHIADWYAALDQWEAAGARFANPVSVLRWNSDKRYLLDFAARGVAVVPSIEALSFDDDTLAEARGQFGPALIVKPPVSGGSHATFRLEPGDAVPDGVRGERMLIQPLMPAILDQGEISLFYLGGELAHAIVKRPTNGDFRVQPQFGGQISAVDAPPAAIAAGEAALAVSGPDLLYARIDLVADGDMYRLMEIELIEPWLYLAHAADRGASFARAVRAALD